ncbi:MAG: threonine--tRNA ligase [Christensenellaceae bacterium]|nr:threonine--tRNA ligase [Christensenellaceae bacterium]
MEVYRHTSAHLLAAAVKSVYPNARLGVSHDNGLEFAYDFDFATPIKTEDLATIEAEMARILAQKPTMEVREATRAEARKLLDKAGEIYKTELLGEIKTGEKITFYKLDTFNDMCAGPHMPDLSKIEAFKLTKITGAYWRADAKNKMLTRIYGVAFEKKSQLDEFLVQQEEIKRRDHNKIGRDLEIFTTVDVIGQGLPLLMPNGAKIIQILQRFVEDEEAKRGYLLTKTPLMAKRDLYEISGHWKHYKDGMFILGDEVLDEEVFALRPMTCPFQFYVYKNSIKSYRDLPVRYNETATLFRNENSGEMHGLIRMRQFTISEGHIICTAGQVEQIFDEVLDLVHYCMRALGIENDVTYRLSKGDPNNREKYIDNPKAWQESENAIRKVLVKNKMKFTEASDEAAYYGPKIDVQCRNVHGKEDTIITIQLDFALAERFDMTYIAENGEKVYPFVIHRTSIGCYERTLAMLIEKYAGALPVWLMPTQAVVMGITDAHNEYVRNVFAKIQSAGIRIQKDTRNEKVGYKIREHTMSKIPYMLVAGDKEIALGAVAVRTREGVDLGVMRVEDFIETVKIQCSTFK